MSIANAAACCSYTIPVQSREGPIFSGQTMEFCMPMNPILKKYNQGDQCQAKAPKGQEGLQWQSKIGYFAIEVFNQGATVFGINTKGLTYAVLSLDVTEYEEVLPDQARTAIGITELGKWILGNFETTEQVKKALTEIKVWGDEVEALKAKLGLHLSIIDAFGKNLILEFIGKKKKMYDNLLGVLTNDPPYPWHVANVRRYNNLTAKTPANDPNNPDSTMGIGNGMIGLPGDLSPPSRFVKVYEALKQMREPKNAITSDEEALTAAQKIANSVDIPPGMCIVDLGGHELTQRQQWATFTNHKTPAIYWRTYLDATLRKIDLADFHFSLGSAPYSIPLEPARATVIQLTPVGAKFLSDAEMC